MIKSHIYHPVKMYMTYQIVHFIISSILSYLFSNDLVESVVAEGIF